MTPGPARPRPGPGPAKRVSVLLGSHDSVHHRSLWVELLREARNCEVAGATAYRGSEGFGASGLLHRAHLLRPDDVPLLLVMVDRAERIDTFLSRTAELLLDALVVIDDVEIVSG